MIIPLIVCAKNEEAMLDACLRSLDAACDHAEERLPITFEKLVVLDDTCDKSAQIAVSRGFTVERSTGGKIEAQRVGARRPAPFRIYCDADIVIAPETLHAVASLMLEDANIHVACPPKQPVPPRARTRLARAIHLYNARQGYAVARGWFSGKLFAIRRWQAPTREELAPRIAAAGRDRFLDLARGLVADDIYLSRAVIAAHGAAAIAHSDGGMVWFRAPETLAGMYLYYRRLRRELERVDRLFPESRPVHRRWGRRRTDWRLLRKAPLDEQLLHAQFRAAVAGCRLLYRLDRFYHRHVAAVRAAEWTPIAETKQPVFDPPA